MSLHVIYLHEYSSIYSDVATGIHSSDITHGTRGKSPAVHGLVGRYYRHAETYEIVLQGSDY